MEKLKNQVWAQIFIIYTRYLIGGTFVFASLIKIKGLRFTSESGAENPINSAWHFFETLYQSGLYWKFIGLGQLIAGFLLMTQRYSKLGALINLPIILNIFIITLSFDFGYTPVVTGFMLLANILLLLWDWNVLKVLFNRMPTFDGTVRLEQHRIWEIIGLMLFAVTFFYRMLINKYQLFHWFLVCTAVGLLGLFVGFRLFKKQQQSI